MSKTIDISHPQGYRRQVGNLLKSDIGKKDFVSGDRLPSLRDLAQRYNVSLGTMSKVIEDLEREELVISRPHVGVFLTSKVDKFLQRSASQVILMLTTFDEDPTRIDSGNTFWQCLTSLMMTICRRKGYDVIHSTVSEKELNPVGMLPKLVQGQREPVGLIFQGSNLDQLAAIEKLGYPTVYPHCMWSSSETLPRVCLDGGGAAFKAVKYLVSQGHEEIGYIGPMESGSGIVDELKYEGYCEAMELMELKIHSKYCWPCLPTLTGAKGVCGALIPTISKLPTAFVATNDLIAIGLINALSKKGLKCPDDVAVVGCDNLEIGSLFTPSLTTFDFDRVNFAEKVVDTLLQRIRRPNTAVKNQFVEMNFIKRQSA